MNFRLTGMLALAVAILGLLIAFWDRDEDTVEERLERARRAFRFDPARVDRLIVDTGDLFIECARHGRQWHLVRPLAARADSVAIERLLGALQDLPRGDIILPPRRTADAYLPYGLDAPRARIAIVAGPVTNQIFIGRRTPLGDGVYVRQTDHAGVARVSTALLALLPASADALRDRTLLAGTPADIERLDIRSAAGYIQLARTKSGDWRIFQPVAARADSAAVGALLEALLGCRVTGFVQDGTSDLAPYGLDSQMAVTAVLNTEIGDGSQMLSFGDSLPGNPALVYARLQAENSIYAVPAGVRQALLVKPEDLRDRRLPGLLPEAIQRVRIEESERVLEFHRDDEGAWHLAAPLQAPAGSEAIQTLLRSWSEVRLTAFANAPDTNPPPAARLIRIVSRDGRTPPVELHVGPQPGDSNSVRVAIAGDSSVAMASPAQLLDAPLDPLLYRSRQILSFPIADIADIQVAGPNGSVRIARDPATGQWIPAESWAANLATVLASLRAETLLANGQTAAAAQDWAAPYATVSATLRGQSGLAVVLWIGGELSPGGPRRAALRGRDLVFALAPQTVAALLPPPPNGAE